MASPDVTPPTIDGLLPAPATPIGVFQALQFDVTDAGSLAGVFVFAAFANGVVDVVHDGNAFTSSYASSTRTVIAGGFRYVVKRAGGWPSAPTLRVRALDARGNAQ